MNASVFDDIRNLPRAVSHTVLCALVLGMTLTSSAEETSQRIIFLGPIAPRILEVEISSGPFSIAATRQKYAAGLFQLLDQNKDGELNETEAQRIPVSGRLLSAAPMLGETWKTLDNAPQDGKLNLSELQQHIEVALGAAVSVEKAPPKLTQTVRLYNDLDLNSDGKITAEEVENGLAALHAFDFDDDETLSVAELQPFPLSVLQAQQQKQAVDEPVPLLLINTEEELALAAERCVHFYGDNGFVEEELATRIAGRQARRFDKDRDQKWDARELAECFKATSAEIRLSVSLAPPMVKLLSEPTQRDPHPTLDLGGVPVELQSRNTRWMATSNVGLLKTTRFANADADGNKYLDEQEFFGLQVGNVDFATVDLDGNAQVTRDEIGQFFTLDGLASQSRVVLSLSDETQTLFDILDQPAEEGMGVQDRRLQPKEFREGRAKLLEYDLNKDGALTEHEFTDSFMITFMQPQLFETDPRRDAAMQNQRNPNMLEDSTTGPIWFQKMDRNQDEEVSWREFLGSRSDFETLDSNQNGYLEAEEAELAEKQRI